MNKLELVAKVGEACEFSKKDAEVAVNAVFNAISSALEDGDDVKISSFGNFVVKERQARTGTKPGTNEKIEIPSRKTVTFKASKTLKDLVK